MLKDFFKDKTTIFAILTDLYAIFGVMYLSWNPYRIIGFYWLDTCVMVLFFLLLLVMRKNLSVPFGFIATLFVLGGLMIVYLQTILGFTVDAGNMNKPLELEALFYPYFDITVFIVLSAASHAYDLRRQFALKSLDIWGFSTISMIGGMLLIPFVLLLSMYVNFIIGQFNLSMILSLIFLRNILELWRFRSIRRFEIEDAKILT